MEEQLAVGVALALEDDLVAHRDGHLGVGDPLAVRVDHLDHVPLGGVERAHGRALIGLQVGLIRLELGVVVDGAGLEGLLLRERRGGPLGGQRRIGGRGHGRHRAAAHREARRGLALGAARSPAAFESEVARLVADHPAAVGDEGARGGGRGHGAAGEGGGDEERGQMLTGHGRSPCGGGVGYRPGKQCNKTLYVCFLFLYTKQTNRGCQPEPPK
ncbi:hypothetical protein D3C72_1704110 [compost metagenome]